MNLDHMFMNLRPGYTLKKNKSIVIELLIIARLLTNEGAMLQNRRPIPKKMPVEVSRFINRVSKKGSKLFKVK